MGTQTCAESHFFKEKSSQVIQKSSNDLTFFQIPKKVKVMTLTFFEGLLDVIPYGTMSEEIR
jgi:hypothetical protein